MITSMLVALVLAESVGIGAPLEEPECEVVPALVHVPPKDLIRIALQTQDHDPEVVLLLTADRDGLVREVTFENSSKNRTVDLAVRNWAFGLKFAPRGCNGLASYRARLPVQLDP